MQSAAAVPQSSTSPSFVTPFSSRRGGQWRTVSKAAPCAICGHTDWCSASDDGARICKRQAGAGAIRRTNSNGEEYFLHPPGGHVRAPMPHPEVVSAPRAAVDVLDEVYRQILGSLPLSRAHRENLGRRGLTDEEIGRRGYRTHPLVGRSDRAGRLVDRYGPEVCASVPGLYLKSENGRSWWTLGGPPGILVPVRDTEGRIIALKVRVDEPRDGQRYFYISSAKHGGPGPGSPVHVPLFDGDAAEVRLVEGELKADICTALSGMMTVGLPSVAAWRPSVPVLRAIGAQEVRLAFDADWRENPTVARALVAAWNGLAMEGF